jgi:hypothetical protein
MVFRRAFEPAPLNGTYKPLVRFCERRRGVSSLKYSTAGDFSNASESVTTYSSVVSARDRKGLAAFGDTLDIGTVIAYKDVTAQGAIRNKEKIHGIQEINQETEEGEEAPTDQATHRRPFQRRRSPAGVVDLQETRSRLASHRRQPRSLLRLTASNASSCLSYR